MPQYYNNQDVLPSVKSVAEDSVKPEHDKNSHKTGRNWKSINVILKNRSFLKKKQKNSWNRSVRKYYSSQHWPLARLFTLDVRILLLMWEKYKSDQVLTSKASSGTQVYLVRFYSMLRGILAIIQGLELLITLLRIQREVPKKEASKTSSLFTKPRSESLLV